jgi:hypothetical protein
MFLSSKIIKLNSLFTQQYATMKKAAYSVITFLLCLACFVSCKKQYHCSCTYNNAVVFTKDLGLQVHDDAKEQCTSYDTTVSGEEWTCTLY